MMQRKLYCCGTAGVLLLLLLFPITVNSGGAFRTLTGHHPTGPVFAVQAAVCVLTPTNLFAMTRSYDVGVGYQK